MGQNIHLKERMNDSIIYQVILSELPYLFGHVGIFGPVV